eukprot:356968-Chlamydomonas_euryale.AAC.4
MQRMTDGVHGMNGPRHECERWSCTIRARLWHASSTADSGSWHPDPLEAASPSRRDTTLQPVEPID